VQEAVGGYFKDPTGTSKMVGSNMQGSGEAFSLSRQDMPKLKEELQKAIRHIDNFEQLKNQIEMTVTAEGLRIELLESETGTFFETGKAIPSPNGKELLIALSAELGKLPNKISLEGHTDAGPYPGGSDYTNWELSVDRANAARRLMQESGVAAGQVVQVRGCADQRLRKPDKPEDASNRRITLIVQYVVNEGSNSLGDSKEKGKEETPKDGASPNASWASRPEDCWSLKRCPTRRWHGCPRCSYRLRCPPRLRA
jgi:chemotaxis protein MotB